MENLLRYLIGIIALCMSVFSYGQDKVKTEFLELGLHVGFLNIEDYPSNTATGAYLTLRATEDFFLQLNLMESSDVDLNNDERNTPFSDILDDRDFFHYDLLIGFNLFQGEFFTGDNQANLSSLYVVGGVGETEFGDESRFTTTLGLGYQIAFNRRYVLRFDLRDYFYKSSLLKDNETTNNIHTFIGLSYLF